MAQHPYFQKSIDLMSEQIQSLQREFGHVYSGKSLIANNVNYPNSPDETAKIRAGVKSLLEGSLLVYLFAMWEAHFPSDIKDWLTQDELEQLNAFQHVRDSAAHKFKGGRADFPNRRQAFENKMPFSEIIWNQIDDTIDLSNSSASYNCLKLMEQLTKQLVVRLHKNEKP